MEQAPEPRAPPLHAGRQHAPKEVEGGNWCASNVMNLRELVGELHELLGDPRLGQEDTPKLVLASRCVSKT